MKKLLRAGLMATIVGSLVAAGLISPAIGGGAERSATKSVSVRDDLFSPRAVSVSRGDKVAWRWKGSNAHNVTFRSVPSGASKPRSATKTSGRFARTFRKRGTYRYVCTIHQDLGMRGTVKVR